MAYMTQISTDWVINTGHNNTPAADGDYRYFWQINYDTNQTNRTTKITVIYYLQTHCTSYTENSLHMSVPAGSGTAYINGESLGKVSNGERTVAKGANLALSELSRKTYTVKHNNDGSASFTFQANAKFNYDSRTLYTNYKTYSTPGNFPAVASYSTLGSINTFDIDTGITSIPITKYVSSYYHTLEISNGSGVIFKTINGIEDGNTISFTESELDDIYSKIPKGNSATFTFKLTTYENSNKTKVIGSPSTKTATGNFAIQLPSVRGGICTDAYENNVSLTGDTTKQTIIKGQSYIKIEIPTNMQAVANTRKATIVEYVVDDVHIPYNANGVSKLLSTSNSSKDHVIIYAVDSRGTSSLPYTQKFTKYIDYNRVSLNTKNYKIERQNNGISRFIDTSFEGTWFSGNFGAKQNSLTPFVYYRANEGQIWNDLNEFVDGASVGRLDMSKLDTSTPGVFKYNGPIMSAESDTGFDIKNSYDMFFGFRDELSNEGFTLTINYGEPAAAVYKNKMALGGPYDEMLGGTQMWGDIYINGEQLPSPKNIEYKRHIVSAYLSSDYSPSVTAWTSYRAKIDTANVTGDKLSFDSANNWIVIGDGVSKIQMTGAVFFDGNTPKGQLRAWCQVRDTDGNARFAVPAYQYMSSGTAIIVNVPTFILNVSPGEVVELIFQTGASGTAKIVARGTSIFVEVIE